MQRITAFVLGVVAVIAAGPSRAADVHVNVNIGAPPPPPVVVQAPPRLVVVPDVPAVRYAPEAPVNFFVYGGRYFSFHDGAWFVATTYGAPWVYVPTVEVPRAVRVVPARYYRIPPGQAKKMYREHHGKHREHGGWHEHGHGHEHHEHGDRDD